MELCVTKNTDSPSVENLRRTIELTFLRATGFTLPSQYIFVYTILHIVSKMFTLKFLSLSRINNFFQPQYSFISLISYRYIGEVFYTCKASVIREEITCSLKRRVQPEPSSSTHRAQRLPMHQVTQVLLLSY